MRIEPVALDHEQMEVSDEYWDIRIGEEENTAGIISDNYGRNQNAQISPVTHKVQSPRQGQKM